MKHLSDLFKKYQTTIKPPQASVEKVCLEVLQDVTGFSLSPDAVTFVLTTKTLKINAPSLVKQELKLHHEEILTVLERKLGVASAPKVIL